MDSPWIAGRPASEAPLAANAPMFSLDPALPHGSQWPDLRLAPRTPMPDTPGPLAITVLRHFGTAISIYSHLDLGRWLGEKVSDYWRENSEGTITIEPVIGPIAPNFPAAADGNPPTAAWACPTR